MTSSSLLPTSYASLTSYNLKRKIIFLVISVQKAFKKSRQFGWNYDVRMLVFIIYPCLAVDQSVYGDSYLYHAKGLL